MAVLCFSYGCLTDFPWNPYRSMCNPCGVPGGGAEPFPAVLAGASEGFGASDDFANMGAAGEAMECLRELAPLIAMFGPAVRGMEVPGGGAEPSSVALADDFGGFGAGAIVDEDVAGEEFPCVLALPPAAGSQGCVSAAVRCAARGSLGAGVALAPGLAAAGGADELLPVATLEVEPLD